MANEQGAYRKPWKPEGGGEVQRFNEPLRVIDKSSHKRIKEGGKISKSKDAEGVLSPGIF